MEKITDFEQRLNLGIDLLEIARTYCEFNYDKAYELSALYSVLEVIIENQKDLVRSLDHLYVS